MRTLLKKNNSLPNLHFLIPNPEAMVSGGNIYNRFFINALQSQNCNVKRVDLTFIKKATSNAKEKKLLIVDTLYLKEVQPIFNSLKKNWYTVLLVHHLESLYPPNGSTSKNYFERKERDVLNQFDAFLTTSHFTSQYLQAQQMTQPILVVPPALTYQAKVLPRKTNTIRAIWVANLIQRKGILPFLQELNKIDPQKYLGQFTIHLFGTDKIEKEYANECLELIEKHPALQQTIHYHGPQSSDQMHQAYQQANLFISTAFMESFGMALQEAVAYQIPILALDRGNLAHHILSGKNGYLHQTLESLSQQMIDLIQSPNIFESLLKGAAQYNPYQSYTWTEAVQQFKDQFLENCSDYYYI